MNRVYERFFQGYSVKFADTHGIVYTPQELVDFMCSSVEHVLRKDFDVTLSSEDVQVLDPCTGTGNFIVNIIRRVGRRELTRVYRRQLFANEVMLLPYYIASQNIEHEYSEITKTYKTFEGMSFVDTLDIAEERQNVFSSMAEINTERGEPAARVTDQGHHRQPAVQYGTDQRERQQQESQVPDRQPEDPAYLREGLDGSAQEQAL